MKPSCFMIVALTAVGIVGNGLAFFVLFSPVYSRKSYSYYLRALAVFDTLTLIITGTPTQCCNQIRLDQIRSSDQIRSDQIRSDQIRSDQIRLDQIGSHQIGSDQTSRALRLYYIEILNRQSSTKCHAPKKKRIECHLLFLYYCSILFSTSSYFFHHMQFQLDCYLSQGPIQKMSKMQSDSIHALGQCFLAWFLLF